MPRLCTKSFKKPKFCSWFKPNLCTQTRSGQGMEALKEVRTRKARYKKIPHTIFNSYTKYVFDQPELNERGRVEQNPELD